jgi:hypothetical protein
MNKTRCCNDLYNMTDGQKLAFRALFNRGKTYHMLAEEAGLDKCPDKLEDVDCFIAQKIIDFHLGKNWKC